MQKAPPRKWRGFCIVRECVCTFMRKHGTIYVLLGHDACAICGSFAYSTMNFWNNPENNSIKITVLVIVIVIAGFFIYQHFHGDALSGTGKVIDTSVKASPSSPASTTLAPTNITATSVVFHGIVAATDVSNTATVNFMYGTTPKYGQTAQGQSDQGGTLSAAVSGLKCRTQYYYRTVAANRNGYTYGAAQKFTTLPCGVSAKVLH